MKTLQRLRATVGTLAVMIVWVHVAILSAQNPGKGEPKLETGQEIFLAACATCHGEGRVMKDRKLHDFIVSKPRNSVKSLYVIPLGQIR